MAATCAYAISHPVWEQVSAMESVLRIKRLDDAVKHTTGV